MTDKKPRPPLVPIVYGYKKPSRPIASWLIIVVMGAAVGFAIVWLWVGRR